VLNDAVWADVNRATVFFNLAVVLYKCLSEYFGIFDGPAVSPFASRRQSLDLQPDFGMTHCWTSKQRVCGLPDFGHLIFGEGRNLSRLSLEENDRYSPEFRQLSIIAE
jgi:hypothetical protein